MLDLLSAWISVLVERTSIAVVPMKGVPSTCRVGVVFFIPTA